MSTALIVDRGNVRFSADGLLAACLATDDAGRRFVEHWQLTPAGPRLAVRAETGHGSPATAQVFPLPGQRVIHSWHSPGRQTIDLVQPDGARRELGRTEAPLRLLPGCSRTGALALALTVETDGRSGLHQIYDGDPWLRPLTRLPGPVGRVAVDTDRAYLTVRIDGRPTPMAVDLATGAVDPLGEPAKHGPGHVLLRGAGQVLLTLATGGGRRLALVPAGHPGPARILELPAGLAGAVAPVALDPTGRTIAMIVSRGARSRLVEWDLDGGGVRQVSGTPEGEFVPLAGWAARGLWLLWSAPTQPPTFGWLPATRPAVWGCADAEPTAPVGWRSGQVETFPGPEGPIEAVVYGDGWRTGHPVVVALHGGPEKHWSLGFDRLFQALAAAGLTVIAPNQRGSTGYDRPHAGAIVGRWGGPDLADIRHLRGFLTAARPAGAPRPALYGSSYGAFLALLAAAADPDSWSACVAVAPFRSAAALHAEAFPPVRNLIDRLRGRDVVDDSLGPRDLDVLAPRIRGRVLIAHGALDEVIPVEQSRALVDRLAAAGRCEVTYHELPDRGHDPIGGHTGPLVHEIVHFLSRADDTARRSPGRLTAPLCLVAGSRDRAIETTERR